jgi:hypothetical protein
MFVYGIRCAPADLAYLPESASADYYLDYGLLIFPHYTRAGCISRASTGSNAAAFWDAVKLLTEDATRAHMVTAGPPHPRLSKGEREVIAEIKRAFPLTEAAWFNVPRIATQARDASAGGC